jgi:hypothetical protein
MLNFLRQIFENPYISNFMKILPMVVDLLRADGETNRRTDIFASHIIANAPKSYYIFCMKKKNIDKKSGKSWNLDS